MYSIIDAEKNEVEPKNSDYKTIWEAYYKMRIEEGKDVYLVEWVSKDEFLVIEH